MLAGLSRAAARLGGTGALADKMDLTTPGLNKVLTGGSTHPKRLWDLLAHDPTVLDDIASEYGVKIVDKSAVCDVDDAGVLITRVLLWLQEATHPEGPGGRSIIHTELIEAERLIRELHSATSSWIDEIDELRRPRVVNG
jgi:hypothetical protein